MKLVPVCLFLVALTLRAALGLLSLDSFDGDPDAYLAIAQTLHDHHVFGLPDRFSQPQPTAFRPPLYPALLSALASGGDSWHGKIAILHALLGAATVTITYQIACSLNAVKVNAVKLNAGKLNAGKQPSVIPLLAATLVLIDPILLRQSVLVMTETLATFFSAAILYACVAWFPPVSNAIGATTKAASPPWRAGLVLGVLLGLAYLTRPTFIVWAALLLSSLLVVSQPRRRSPALICGLVVATFVAGWTWRNTRALGAPIWATTHGGYTLLLGNNPLFYEYLKNGEWGETWDTTSFFAAYNRRYLADPTTAEFWNVDEPNASTQTSQTKPLGNVPEATEMSITEPSDDKLVYSAAKATISRDPGMFVFSSLVRLGRLWAPFPHATGDRSIATVSAIGGYYVLLYLAAAIGIWKLQLARSHPMFWASLSLLLTLSVVHSVYWSNLRMRAPAVPVLALFAAASLATRSQIQASKEP